MTRVTTQPTSGRPFINREVLGGFGIMAVGFVLLSDPAVEINLWASGWTLVLVLVGLVRFIDPSLGDGECPSRRTGAWLMAVGVWGFVSQNRLLGLSFKTAWPLLLTAAGVIMVWWAIDEARRTSLARKAD